MAEDWILCFLSLGASARQDTMAVKNMDARYWWCKFEFQICSLPAVCCGQADSPLVSQFPHLENRNDSNCLTDRVILNIKWGNIFKTLLSGCGAIYIEYLLLLFVWAYVSIYDYIGMEKTMGKYKLCWKYS